ncbi:hypothetical protein IM792_16180 [Mucilaginibacter sp. JRF]|uniref:hypothetical protein n=1 Tax=Mucilaginibacter sp. JRF TaxID=2780088 RepID=UPI00188301D4|nr:hypothetical protein [Mucilaginibacter sp. JRF]MBE9585993.1 hypothetical protein [Mucilaginibacter sp. JRF]
MLDRLYRLDSVVGLQMHIQPDGSLKLSACRIRIKGSALEIEKKWPSLTSVKSLQDELPKGTVLALNISGKGILTKVVEQVSEDTAPDLSAILPGAAAADYYRQDFRSGSRVFVSLSRKKDIEQVIGQLRLGGLKLLSVSLGAFVMDQVLPQLNHYGGPLIFDGHQVMLEGKELWTAYRYEEDQQAATPLKIETEKLDERLLLPYAAAFQLALHDRLSLIGVDIDSIADTRERYLQTKKVKAQGMIILSIFFVLLLANFMIFSQLNSENQQLEEQVRLLQQNSGDVKLQQNKIREQENLLREVGWNGPRLKSGMIDQLCALLPSGVVLNAIEINPVDQKKTRELKSTFFADHQIVVRGNADRVINVNEWLALITTLKWVKKAELETYKVDPENGQGQFQIIINY